MAKNKKISLQSLLYNTNFLVGFSFAMALIIWIAVTLNESPEVERTIKNVKVEIDTSVPEQLGYKVYGQDEYFVDVTVRGRRYLVGDNVLSAKDIKVTAITNYVNSVGKQSLKLRATPDSSNAGYKIVSTSVDYIDVYFDTPKSIDMTITPDIIVSDKLLFSDEFVSDIPVLSTDRIKISGPATEINKIKKVSARINVEEPLKATKSFPAELLIVDEYGRSLKYLEITPKLDSLTITVPVYKVAQMPVSVSFKNAPAGYLGSELNIVASPATIKIAAPEDVLSSMTTLNVGEIDFNSIRNGENKFSFKTADISNIKVLDNVETISVSVDVVGGKSIKSKVNSSNISIVNAPAGSKIKIAQNSIQNVVLVGPSNDISNLTVDDIYAEINLEDKKLTAGKHTVTANVKVKNDRCWAYGNYKVQITVTN